MLTALLLPGVNWDDVAVLYHDGCHWSDVAFFLWPVSIGAMWEAFLFQGLTGQRLRRSLQQAVNWTDIGFICFWYQLV